MSLKIGMPKPGGTIPKAIPKLNIKAAEKVKIKEAQNTDSTTPIS